MKPNMADEADISTATAGGGREAQVKAASTAIWLIARQIGLNAALVVLWDASNGSQPRLRRPRAVTKPSGTKIRASEPRISTRAARITTPKVAAAIYQTAQYKEWRWQVIRRSGGRCQDPQCTDPMRSTRLFCDHIRELRDGGAPFDVANGVVLCGACHSRKTLAERARRMAAR